MSNSTRQGRKPQVNVGVDFERGRGFDNMGEGLPGNFLTFERGKVCGTIAALYHNPVSERGNTMSVAMVQLALYAGGFAVTLTKSQFRQLERKVKDYAAVMRAPQFAAYNNLGFAEYVLRHALARAKVERVI